MINVAWVPALMAISLCGLHIVRATAAMGFAAPAVETVVLVSDKDGWSVVGYHIN